MITRWMQVVVACSVLGVGGLAASAAPKHPHGQAGETPKCPVCKMPLTTKKDKMHTVAVKVHGKTYYCCAQCNMNGHGGAKQHHHAASHHKM